MSDQLETIKSRLAHIEFNIHEKDLEINYELMNILDRLEKVEKEFENLIKCKDEFFQIRGQVDVLIAQSTKSTKLNINTGDSGMDAISYKYIGISIVIILIIILTAMFLNILNIEDIKNILDGIS